MAKSTKIYATAPYNFVALPSKPLPSEISSVENFKAHIKSRGKLSGEIALEIETLTPLFIGGNLTDIALNFAPNGTPIIPGSSLRGMFKNIFKIVTCGTFRGCAGSQRIGEDFNDEHVYFRCLMGVNDMPWTKDLNALYNGRMIGENGKNAQPGFLIKTAGGKYFIVPSKVGDNKTNRTPIYDKIFRNLKKSCVIWDDKEKGKAYIFTGRGGRKKFVRFTRVEYADWNKRLELPDDVRESYEHDRNRRGVNLLTDSGILNRNQLEKIVPNLPRDVKSLIPCHFLRKDEKSDEVTAFGHGQCFRIPYEKAIGELVPAALKDTAVIDFADAVFGREKFWASRVYFEDAVPVETPKTLGKTEQILVQPNPTSYQLYLAQDGSETLSHWDSPDAQVRGYKLYWHNDSDDWKKGTAGSNDNKNITKPLTPLAKGTKFTAKIRFQNLSEVELGALMMIFDLNGEGKTAAYKISMGKPLGFGSVRITPKLFVESDDAYAELFGGTGWANPYRAENPAKYLADFKKYLSGKISDWENVMAELNAILSWDNRPAPKKIQAMRSVYDGKTMQVDEKFKQRNVLQTILDVVK